MKVLRNAAFQMAFSVSVLFVACALLGSVAVVAPALAQEQSCRTAATVFQEATQLNVTADRITTTEDLEFIVAYLEAIRLGVPDDSDPKRFIMIDLGARVYIAIVEQDGCIKYQAAVGAADHVAALKAAAAGV